MGIACRVIPVSDDPLRTELEAEDGERLSFQDYFVRRQQHDRIARVFFEGTASPAPGVLDAIADADVVIIPPSNPLVTIGPMLAVVGDALRSTRARRVAISPIVGGRALKGPLVSLMQSMGHEVSSAGVARIYDGLIDVLLVDEPVEAEVGTVVCDTLMRSPDDAARLAKLALA
jgi:LPPG:FO 2-phospho-L-lactate transferase